MLHFGQSLIRATAPGEWSLSFYRGCFSNDNKQLGKVRKYEMGGTAILQEIHNNHFFGKSSNTSAAKVIIAITTITITVHSNTIIITRTTVTLPFQV